MSESEWPGSRAGQPLVRVRDADGAALIVRWNSGVWYTNQAGGHSCMQPEAEGIFVPLNPIVSDQGRAVALEETLSACRWPGVALHAGVSPNEADCVDAALEKHKLDGITVNRSRLRDSMEAWVFVDVSAVDSPGLRVLVDWSTPLEAVLVWGNSD